jgi:sugar lactone lactonase YvrE
MGFMVTNGPAWSLDGRTFYFTDSAARRIYAFEFDMASGELGARRLFVEQPVDQGYPDGQCVDAEDHLWTAQWDGARVTRYRPDGTVERTISLPAPRVTSCCFGGDNLDTLYVTTALVGMTAAELQAAPLAGGLLAVTGLGVRGLPSARFAG